MIRASGGLPGFLQGDAVQAAEAEHDVRAVDAKDLSIIEQIGEDFQRQSVLGAAIGWNEHRAVADVEVGVARRTA